VMQGLERLLRSTPCEARAEYRSYKPAAMETHTHGRSNTAKSYLPEEILRKYSTLAKRG